MPELPTPHGYKLTALLQSQKLPATDHPLVEQAILRYEEWIKQLRVVKGTYREIVTEMVRLLNDYKQYIELELIFDSRNDFLYRQKGQLKLDNTILEEFLPILVATALSDGFQGYDLSFGPANCFSGIRFESGITTPEPGGGMKIRAKDHDFAISKKIFIRASHDPNFEENITEATNIAYVAAECKTNLDKTMFQEAAATALDVKTTVPGAKYYLLCEWLDMTPISTHMTAIDEVIILRKARRISANIRSQFNTAEGRHKNRDFFAEYLREHPLSTETFLRLLEHIRSLIKDSSDTEVLERGYF